jgi:hypothetical protein
LEQGRDAREEEKKTKERIKKYRDNERKVWVRKLDKNIHIYTSTTNTMLLIIYNKLII